MSIGNILQSGARAIRRWFNDPLHSAVVKLTRSAFAGKPFLVSEVNHPRPNEFLSEMIPILAAYSAFQDWDGVFFYSFEPS